MKPKHSSPHGRPVVFLGLLLILLLISVFGFGSSGQSSTLKAITNCKLVSMQGADGDSFLVEFPDKTKHVVRLYAVDCIEANIWDESDSRRLREQRRYFGISGFGANTEASIRVAKQFGKLAHREVQDKLSTPFTVHTAFADGRGSGYHKRIYAFISTSEGIDLGTHLVSIGLARAFGVCRKNPEGLDRDELRSRLDDLEIRAAKLGKGVWAMTDWESFSQERASQRHEEAELALAIDRVKATAIVDPNTAPRDQLMTLPGIGETLAVRIIENRPYQSSDDLLKLKSVGEGTLQRIGNRLPKKFRLTSDTSKQSAIANIDAG